MHPLTGPSQPSSEAATRWVTLSLRQPPPAQRTASRRQVGCSKWMPVSSSTDVTGGCKESTDWDGTGIVVTAVPQRSVAANPSLYREWEMSWGRSEVDSSTTGCGRAEGGEAFGEGEGTHVS